MSKAVIYPVIVIAFILLLLSCRNYLNSNNHRLHRLRGLNRRLGFDPDSMPIFDPLVAKMKSAGEEEQKEIKEEEKQYYDQGKLKISLRLMVLFPFLDKSPKDGYVDAKELEEWIILQTIDRLHHRVKREMQLRDKNRDNAISFEEFLPQYANKQIDITDTTHGGAGWWMEQFQNADFDKNGTLNIFEFRDFLYPQNSENENIQRWLLRQKISHLDHDNDQKLNLVEFEHGAYNSYKTFIDFEDGTKDLPTPPHLFNKLDTDRDGFLVAEELRPLAKYLNPGELTFAKYYASFLLGEADDNNDGRLTIDEMLNHEYTFYDTVYDSERHADDYDEMFHDEL